MPYTVDKDFDWFIANQAELFRQYPGKHLVIRNQEVLGAYPDGPTAIRQTKLPLGEYMLQLCLEGEEAYTVDAYGGVETA